MTDFSAIHSQPGLVKTIFISKLKLGGLVESSRLFKQNQLPDAFHFIRLLGTIHHSLGTNKYTTHINWSSGKHKGLDRVFPLTNFPQPLPDIFSFTYSFPFFFGIIISANSSTRRNPARNQRRVFGTFSSNSHEPLWEQRTLSLISFTEDTALLCSAGAELQTEKAKKRRLFSSVHILQSGHEKCGLVSLLVRTDDTHYMASPSLCCYEMAGQKDRRWLAAETQCSLWQNTFYPPVDLQLVNIISHFQRNVMKYGWNAWELCCIYSQISVQAEYFTVWRSLKVHSCCLQITVELEQITSVSLQK